VFEHNFVQQHIDVEWCLDENGCQREPIFTTWSAFNPLALPAPQLLLLFPANQPSHWKSQIAHLGMHHLVFGINYRFIWSASPFLSQFTSSFTCQPTCQTVLSASITPLLFIVRQHTDARYWYSKSVCPSVRYIPVPDENGLTYRHSFYTIR